VLAVLVVLAAAGQLPAEERDSPQRRQALRLNQITGMDPIRGEVRALLADKGAARKLVSEAARMVKEKPQPFSYNATLILATAASELKDYPAAETFYRVHIDQAKQLLSAKGLISAYGGLIVTMTAEKKYAEAEKVCKEVLALRSAPPGEDDDDNSLERFKSVVLEEMIKAVARQGDADRAIDLIDRVLKNSPNSWVALDLKADVYRIADRNQEAAKFYEEALESVRKAADLKQESKDGMIEEIRYTLSGVYVDLGQIDKAAQQLKALLEKKPDNPTYNNDLGYIWADHDMNLAESEKLVRKAIEHERKLRQKLKGKLKPEDDKDSAAYLDSLGWVLFKQKKYQEAKKYLRDAVAQEDGKHVEILDHLGEVHMALGEKAEALATWQKGVEAAGDSMREQKRKAEVLKKIKANE
jgi:tetratricopeptide (TPR) repeat protein